jgi:putative redox protein
MPAQRVSFHNGKHDLAGRLHLPAGPARAWAVFAHCFTCSKDLRAAREIAEALAGRGVGVLRFDFSGLGQSEGDFADSTFSTDVGDLVAAANWLTAEHAAPTLLVGHSLGGAAVLKAAVQLPSVRAVATVGAPAEPAHATHLFEEHEETIRTDGQATVELAGRPFVISEALLADLEEQSIASCISGLRRALLVLHSPQDNTVGIEQARHIYEAARHPKSFVTLDGADHLLTEPADARYAGQVIATWAERYLGDPVDVATHGDDVEVRGGRFGFAQQIVARGAHHLRADEPIGIGTDTGPTPYELLLAGLGACTSMTMRMYADRKGWPLEEAVVHLKHSKQHATDAAKGAKIDVIDKEIELRGDLDATQRARLLEIADRCPVHRTLHSDVVITTVER